jgi:hypothetical protein
MRNNFPCGSKFKFKTKVEIKILEAELLLNLGKFCWRYKPIWKNLINCPKFLFGLTFQNVNLDWHSCMAKIGDYTLVATVKTKVVTVTSHWHALVHIFNYTYTYRKLITS